MSKYKLSAEEIRKLANEIAGEYADENSACQDLIAFAEAVTGEKIPEPFDVSKVKHGTVWRGARGTTLLVVNSVYDNGMDVIVLKHERETQEDGLIGDWRHGHRTVADTLSSSGYTYLGQYDFAAGLPKL